MRNLLVRPVPMSCFLTLTMVFAACFAVQAGEKTGKKKKLATQTADTKAAAKTDKSAETTTRKTAQH
jgi:hypothetical protein